jgi:hypothetical protein
MMVSQMQLPLWSSQGSIPDPDSKSAANAFSTNKTAKQFNRETIRAAYFLLLARLLPRGLPTKLSLVLTRSISYGLS